MYDDIFSKISSGGDHGRTGNADRQDSDGDDSDGPDDEDNDGEEEDEEDSQAESGLSATPSVSASPQHLQSSQGDPAPSSLLAQMSISPNPNPTPLPHIPGTKPQALDTDSFAITSSVSLVRQIPSSAVCSIHGPSLSSFVSYPAPTSEFNSSDTESVHMMSPVSPSRQMSIDYPDLDVPPSPPMPSKNSLSGQVRYVSFPFYLFSFLCLSIYTLLYTYAESSMAVILQKLIGEKVHSFIKICTMK